MNIRFKGYDCVLRQAQYYTGQPCLQLMRGLEVVAVCTVNQPGYLLKDGEVIIKDYSENSGMLDTLIDAGVVSEPVDTIMSGYVTLYVCKLLIP